MPSSTVQPLPAIRRIPISNRFTIREVLKSDLIHGIAELFAGDALEAVTLAVLMLKDAASHLSCSVFRFPTVVTTAIRADTPHFSCLAWNEFERCLIQKHLIQTVDTL